MTADSILHFIVTTLGFDSTSHMAGCYLFTGEPDIIVFTINESSILFSEREFDVVELKEDKLTRPRNNSYCQMKLARSLQLYTLWL